MKRVRPLLLLSLLPLFLFTQGCMIGFEPLPLQSDVRLTVYANDLRGALSLDLNASGDEVCFDFDQQIQLEVTHLASGRTFQRMADCADTVIHLETLQPGRYRVDVTRLYSDGDEYEEDSHVVNVIAGRRATLDLALEDD